MSQLEPARQIINFCQYSIDSCNSKVIFTAGVVLFNHLLSYKGNIKELTPELFSLVMKITDNISKNGDQESISALLLAQTRALYKNQDLLDKVMEVKDKFVAQNKQVMASTNFDEVKKGISDLLSLLGE